MLRLAVPGIDELIGLVEIVRLSAGFEVVVVDTAPTGHALRLLTSPQAVQSLVRVLDALQRDHRIVRKQLARVDRPEAADRLIAALEQRGDGRARAAAGSHEDPVSLGHAPRAARGCRNGGCASVRSPKSA